MRAHHAKTLAILLGLTLILSVFSSAVFAAESAGFELPVKVDLSGTPPTKAEDYKIVLEADNPEYPMPYGSKNGIFTLTITGPNTVNLPRIQYSSPGVYTYEIYQLKGSDESASYDDRKYQLVVYVTNAEDGNALETTVLLYMLGKEGKLDQVSFKNDYESPLIPDKPQAPVKPYEPPAEPPLKARPDVPKTGDDALIWPYIGLFISGLGMLIIVGFTIKKKKPMNKN